MVKDMDALIKKLEPVKEVPKTNRGTQRHTWKPILEYAVGKGYMRISEDDVSIQSAITGLNKEATLQNLDAVLNTRRINGKVWLYIIVKSPKK